MAAALIDSASNPGALAVLVLIVLAGVFNSLLKYAKGPSLPPHASRVLLGISVLSATILTALLVSAIWPRGTAGGGESATGAGSAVSRETSIKQHTEGDQSPAVVSAGDAEVSIERD